MKVTSSLAWLVLVASIQSPDLAAESILCKQVAFSCFADDTKSCLEFCDAYPEQEAIAQCKTLRGTMSRISQCEHQPRTLTREGGGCRFQTGGRAYIAWLYSGNPREWGEWCVSEKGKWVGFSEGVDSKRAAACSGTRSPCQESCASKYNTRSYAYRACTDRCECNVQKCECSSGHNDSCVRIQYYCH